MSRLENWRVMLISAEVEAELGNTPTLNCYIHTLCLQKWANPQNSRAFCELLDLVGSGRRKSPSFCCGKITSFSHLPIHISFLISPSMFSDRVLHNQWELQTDRDTFLDRQCNGARYVNICKIMCLPSTVEQQLNYLARRNEGSQITGPAGAHIVQLGQHQV